MQTMVETRLKKVNHRRCHTASARSTPLASQEADGYEADTALPVFILSTEELGFTEVASLHLLLWILKDPHRSLHSHEAELSVERFFSGDRIQDDFLVTT